MGASGSYCSSARTHIAKGEGEFESE